MSQYNFSSSRAHHPTDSPLPSSEHSFLLFGPSDSDTTTLFQATLQATEVKRSLLPCFSSQILIPVSQHTLTSRADGQMLVYPESPRTTNSLQEQLIAMAEKMNNGITSFFFAISLKQTQYDESIKLILDYLAQNYGDEVYKRSKAIIINHDELVPLSAQSKARNIEDRCQDLGIDCAFEYNPKVRNMDAFIDDLLSEREKIHPLKNRSRVRTVDELCHIRAVQEIKHRDQPSLRKCLLKRALEKEYSRAELLALSARSQAQDVEQKDKAKQIMMNGLRSREVRRRIQRNTRQTTTCMVLQSGCQFLSTLFSYL